LLSCLANVSAVVLFQICTDFGAGVIQPTLSEVEPGNWTSCVVVD
jgi:hypothetical protein